MSNGESSSTEGLPEDLTENDLTNFSKYSTNITCIKTSKYVFLVTTTYWMTVDDHSRVESIMRHIYIIHWSWKTRVWNRNYTFRFWFRYLIFEIGFSVFISIFNTYFTDIPKKYNHFKEDGSLWITLYFLTMECG